ncbi:DUF6958 family protein [Neotabrizicola shimadae]|uniref:Uncharacterized protein n=1 Tax=Neotabrizicola shimadae TaxID=2807096 RepID=A0A8G1EC68_9RHOB|nr:hypothetical protein [Neotabrizicola shimadae]QYZ68743.1 hypothetical protein JO391_13315 [Neotabrizicola shimadae]
MADDRIEVLNVNAPHHVTRVDRAKYEAMRHALLAVLPDAPPGMTPAEAQAALLPHLDATLFPGGEKAGWWMKCVQLDLEARGVLARAPKAPVRLHRTGNVG